ncbi:MAG: rod shape-determining protein [Clostridiales bacterium]|jgi:rod shape-determining protein MreB|nr:rod shape-determining protein [Clostridiales bacterium]
MLPLELYTCLWLNLNLRGKTIEAMVMELAIELGTSNTAIFLNNTGLVLFEPTVVAFSRSAKRNKIKAFGKDALRLLSTNPDDTVLISPIDGGLLLDVDACVLMLKDYIKRLIPKTAILNPKFRSVLNVPIGLSDKERAAFESVCYRAGINDVILIDSILSSAVGMDLPIASDGCFCVINIGAGRTDIAVVSNNCVIEGCSLNIGGNLLDMAIMEYFGTTLGVNVTRTAAIKLKHDIGSLYPNDGLETQVLGLNASNSQPVNIVLKSLDIYGVIKPYFDKILDGIKSVLSNCTQQVVQDIQYKGIYLCGGSSQIPGIDVMYQDLLGVSVWSVDNAIYTSIMGAGKLLYFKDLLADVIKKS